MKTVARLKGEIPKSDFKSIPECDDLAQSLKKEIDASIRRGLTGTNRTIKGFHPSNTNECSRFLVYMFRGAFLPSHNNPRLQRIFDNGHGFHKRIGDYFEAMGIVVALEKPVNTTLYYEDSKGNRFPVPIEGTCDGIIDWDGEAIVEFKSISDAGFAHRRIFKKPKPEHIRQVQIYMAATGLDRAYVVYENKNTQDILVFEVEYDEAFIKKTLRKYAKVYKAFKDGKLPTRYSSPTSQHCQYCNLRDPCWADKEVGEKI